MRVKSLLVYVPHHAEAHVFVRDGRAAILLSREQLIAGTADCSNHLDMLQMIQLKINKILNYEQSHE